MAKQRIFSSASYEIQSVVPCTGFQAVFAIDDDAGSGKCTLQGFPVDALGVASVTIRRFIEQDGRTHFVRVDDPYRDVVGLMLESGSFVIANESSNYAGLCRHGDDFADLAVNLDRETEERLRSPSKGKEA